VSLLSSKRLRLEIGPHALRASVWSGLIRRERLVDATVEIDAGDSEDAALGRLLDQLDRKAHIGGASVDVEIASSLLHFDVVEGEFDAMSERQLTSLARAAVVELLGERSEDHVITWHLQQGQRHLLIVAIPNHWLQSVRKVAAAHGVTPASVRPAFNRQWNAFMARQAPADGVFAVADHDDVVIAFVQRGAITAVSCGPCYEDPGRFSDSMARLMAELVLARKNKFAPIDLQVDRMLSGLGIDPEAPGRYLLVARGEPPARLSTRWAVKPPAGVSA
jgi:hypothetical protein